MSYEHLIEKHGSMVYRLAFSYTQNKDDAEDAMQNVFMRLVKAQPTFNDDEHEKAWFIKVTINACKSLHLSVWKKRIVLVPIEKIKTRTRKIKDSESDVPGALKKLTDKQRLCIHLFYYEEYSITEIAEMSKMNESTIKSHLKRGREKLREELLCVENDT